MFVSKIRADGGDDRSPWGDFWFEPVSMRTMSGVNVSGDSALRLIAVYACVRLLSEIRASLPLRLYKPRVGGGKDYVTDHWLYRLLAKHPNPWQSPFEWTEMVQCHLVMRGNAYNRIVPNARGTEIAQLLPVHPDRITPKLLTNGSVAYEVRNTDGTTETVNRHEIWHLRGLSSNGLVGYNPIELARESIGGGLAMQDYGARFFANDARPMGGWIEMQGAFKDKEARNTWRESWQAAQSGSNRGKTAVLESGMKYHELGLKNSDSQFIEAMAMKVTDIARLFRVPPHLIGDLSKATFSNIEQQSLEFVKYTMTPWAERWESSIETWLCPDEGLEVEFDMDNLERGDSKARAEYYNKGILDGWLVRNEARLKENLNPIDGLDEPLQPLNMVTAGDQPDPDPDPADDEPVPPNPAEARLAAYREAGARRMVRKEEAALSRLVEKHGAGGDAFLAAADAFITKHVDEVAEAMCLTSDQAGAWCNSLSLEVRGIIIRSTDDRITELANLAAKCTAESPAP